VARTADLAETVIRCNEIQTALGSMEVPEFETLPEMRMAARLALHLQGLPVIKIALLKLAQSHYLKIPKLAVERVVRLLADVQFVRLQPLGTRCLALLLDCWKF
jgi:hypothetical protein